MNASVDLFFVSTTLAALLLAVKFMGRNDGVFKTFGIALMLNGIAFAVWSYGLILQPGSLLTCVTIGAVLVLASFVLLLNVSTQRAQSSTRWLLTALGVIAVAGIFYVGRTDPSTAYVSPEGLLFFNLGPLVQMLYIFGLALTALPAIDTVASKFTSWYAPLVRYGFIAEVVGGIILITSKDVPTLTITGWIIGLVYAVLLVTLLFNRRAWPGSN